MTPPRSLRGRLFLVLLAVALVPVTLAVVSGAALLREFVVTTGTAGAWDQVAGSGRALLEAVEGLPDGSPELMAAAERHQAELAESVRFSRLYSFLGEQLLVLLPFAAVGLFLLAGGLAFATAAWLSRGLSRPVEELVGWTQRLGAGEPLPQTGEAGPGAEIREFEALRSAFRSAERALAAARAGEAERIRTRSWAEMARQVAHELKNPLTPMGMAAETVADSAEPRVAAAGEVLREEIRRLDGLARTFAQFGKPVEGLPSLVDLTELCTTVVRRLSTPELPIEVKGPNRPVEVEGHLDALERVVRNLVANAQDAVGAMGGGAAAREAPVEVLLVERADGATILVRDRGPGIPGELLSRIWEPDFTTKRRGTGLGLALVRQAVLAHGGEVEARNREGGGAEFEVWVPRGGTGGAIRG